MSPIVTSLACVAPFILLALVVYFALLGSRWGKAGPVNGPVQFSLKRLMVAVAMIAMGVTMFLQVWNRPWSVLAGILWIPAGMILCVGLLCPFHEEKFGAWVGFIIQLGSGFFALFTHIV